MRRRRRRGREDSVAKDDVLGVIYTAVIFE